MIAAVINTGLPIGAVFGVIMALGNFKESDLDIWHDRLIEGIKGWADGHPELVEAVGWPPTGWDQDFLAALEKMGASALLGSDPHTREVLEEALARTAFLPLIATDTSWQAGRIAARQLADDLPGLLVAAAGPESGLAGLLQILRSDLEDILGRLPPLPANRVVCEAYLNVVIDEFDHDPWTRMAGGRESSLTAIAGRLHVTARPDTGYRVDGEHSETGDACELATRCERIVLLGGPGAGKSWLARRIVIDAAEQADEELAAQADPAMVEIPLFARCAAVFATSLPAWEAVVSAALAQVGHRLGSNQLTEALRRRFLEQTGRFLVVLDGLDEADHLLYGDILDRLAATADRQLRIVLTSRPESWRRQLPLTEQNDRHRVAELQPMDDSEVLAVVNVWLADHRDARDGLIARLKDIPELAQAAKTPLMCAMYCLLAESGNMTPVTGDELTARVVRRLLEGTWRGQHLDPQRQAAALKALRQLAWAGAVSDPVTGLSAWPEMVSHTFDPLLPEIVESAVSHVAPTAPYNPDRLDPARQFLHPSIREHLVAEYVAALPSAQAQDEIEPHLWYDPQWQQVLPWAITGHQERDMLLDALLGATGAADLLPALERRDGFGELRRLLVRLAAESSPDHWSEPHAALIDGVVSQFIRTAGIRYESRWLSIAGRGWPGARPNARDLADVGSRNIWWPQSEIRAWVAHLDLSAEERQRVVQDLVDYLCGRPGRRRHYSTKTSVETSVATMLDALNPSSSVRLAAINGLIEKLRSAARPDDVLALRVLSDEPATDSLLRAVVAQLPTELDGSPDLRWSDYRLDLSAAALYLLGADEAVRRDALVRILDYLAKIPAEQIDVGKIIDAVVRLRPAVPERIRALELLLGRLSVRTDTSHRRQLMRNIDALLPPPAEAGTVLVEIIRRAGPGT